MKNIFKCLFSHRRGLIQTQQIIMKDAIKQEVINAISNCYDVMCANLETIRIDFRHSRSNFFLQQDIERELWIHFVNRRLSEFEQNGHYYLIFNELLLTGQLSWNRILDMIEYVCKWVSLNVPNYNYLEGILNDFEANINNEFDRLDYGYRIVNHCIMDITAEAEIEAINEAVNNSKDNVSTHIQSAIENYSARPNPDIRNSIKESISAVEATCRELTGENTLGNALKRLEDNGVVIHKMLKDEFVKFYAYTNDPNSGIRHALMDNDGTYVPSKDEAYYMLVSCSTFINYLRRKAAP